MIFEFRYRVGQASPDRIRTRLLDDAYLVMERDSTGWASELVPIAWTITTHRVTGIIQSSLNEAIHQAIADSVLPFAERDRLIWNTAEAVYGWVIDFTRDIRPGDDFQILYERLTSDAGDVRYGRVLAAHVETQGAMNTAYVVTGDGGNNVYYDDTGRSLHRAFLKYPVQFRRISSVFTRRRYHPVLRIYRAHLGYDFAADIGTPIRATGDGTIIRANRNGGYGLMVSIRHPKGFETRYAHMSRIANGIRPGVRVTQGQTVGYVGMTGLANGPHVHYEFLKSGRHINYRNVDLGDGEALPESLEADFAVQRAEFDRLLVEQAPRVPALLGGAE
jgi:murein DD-endopeptidase MepM/ murein hydrolase activator NlpD